MTPEARIFVAGLGLLFLFIVLRSLRSHRLKFEYSLLWICLSLLLVLAAVFQRTADRVAAWVGIDYPPAFFFLVCLFAVLVMLFQFSIRLSVLSDRLQRLTQETAVRSALESSERGSKEDGDPAGTGLAGNEKGSRVADANRGRRDG